MHSLRTGAGAGAVRTLPGSPSQAQLASPDLVRVLRRCFGALTAAISRDTCTLQCVRGGGGREVTVYKHCSTRARSAGGHYTPS